jgi:hypothetical protein
MSKPISENIPITEMESSRDALVNPGKEGEEQVAVIIGEAGSCKSRQMFKFQIGIEQKGCLSFFRNAERSLQHCKTK